MPDSPLNMGTPWNTISGPNAVPADDIPEMQNLHQALAGMRDFQSRAMVANQQNEQVLPPQSIQVNTAKGTVTMKDLPIATYEAFNRDRQQLNEIRGAFHQESERLKNQEQQARNQPPWVQLATALSANLASQKDMPGWVRGLGQTAAQLNPRPEQIQARRFGVMEEEAKLAQQAGQMDVSALTQQRLGEGQTARMSEADQRIHDNQLKLGQEAAKDGRLRPEALAGYTKLSPEEKQSLLVQSQAKVEAVKAEKERASAEKTALVQLKIQGAATAAEKGHAYRQAEIAQRLQGSMNHLEKSHEYAKDMNDYKQSLATDKALAIVPPKEKTRLIDLDGISRYADSTRELLNLPEMKGYEGPLTPERLLPRFAQSPNLVKYNEWVNQELPRINSMIKGGVRLISSPQGRDFVKSHLGFTEYMTADQIRGVLDNVDQIVGNERRSVMDATPAAPWSKYPELLGKDYDYASVLASNPARGGAARPAAAGKRLVFNPDTGKVEEK